MAAFEVLAASDDDRTSLLRNHMHEGPLGHFNQVQPPPNHSSRLPTHSGGASDAVSVHVAPANASSTDGRHSRHTGSSGVGPSTNSRSTGTTAGNSSGAGRLPQPWPTQLLQPQLLDPERRKANRWATLLLLITGAGLLVSLVSLGIATHAQGLNGVSPGGSSGGGGSNGLGGGGGGDALDGPSSTWQRVSRIASGSCTSYDMRPQPVWTRGVIPAKPDAWLWIGDMAYTDTSDVDCHAVPSFPQCTCNATFYAHPGQCNAGNVDHARDRLAYQLSLPDYQAFLEYMCPGSAAAGYFPPPGSDPRVCPRPILGTYDDHDYGGNNANKRLPHKHEFKNLFLDALGEAQSSSRRSSDNGLQYKYTLNCGTVGREVDVLLLDERYDRDPLPCEIRRNWCLSMLATSAPGSTSYVVCHDFLMEDGSTGHGSCCTKDEEWAVWCSLTNSRTHPRWRFLCNPTSSDFGSLPLLLGPDNITVLDVGDLTLWSAQKMADMWPRLPVKGYSASTMCEMLGMRQRRWLQHSLAESTAPLIIVASGSVLLGSLGYVDKAKGVCSDDDWNCFQPAQVSLLHTLANASGCVVVLTGDYHYGDIKVALPGPQHAYAGQLRSQSLAKPVYQLMGSGMTSSTAGGATASPCNGTYREDLVGLRPLGPCAYVPQPNFGMIDIDWESGVVKLQVLDAIGGEVAIGLDGSRQEVAFDLRTCKLL